MPLTKLSFKPIDSKEATGLTPGVVSKSASDGLSTAALNSGLVEVFVRGVPVESTVLEAGKRNLAVTLLDELQKSMNITIRIIVNILHETGIGRARLRSRRLPAFSRLTMIPPGCILPHRYVHINNINKAGLRRTQQVGGSWEIFAATAIFIFFFWLNMY